MKTKLCPCGSKKTYAVCCGRYHKGKIHAPTAEALMRSRYSAYVLKETQYLYRSWEQSTRPSLQELRKENSQVFIGLEILNITKGRIEDETATVEFIASYTFSDKKHNKIYRHHENSYFVKRNNRWFYLNKLGKP